MQLTLEENVFLGSLPPEVRLDVEQWREALLKLCPDSPRREEGGEGVQRRLAKIARDFGVSVQTARRKYDLFRRSRNLRVLVNRSRVPKVASALRPEFVKWFKAQTELNQRASAPAYRAFLRKWKNGETIPGMDNALPRHELPPGFSYDNVLARCKDKFATTAMRRGLGLALAKFGPQILTTRARLWYGSHLMLDDLWHDNFVVFGRQIVRVLELDALDVFSGHLEDFGCKPRFRREDGTFDNLKEKYARLLVAKIYFQRGYSPRGSTNLVEHGTAALSERVRKILFDRSGGLITTRDSGITGEEQAIIGWRGQGKGNPRFKAALESLRNLKHNELGMLPAQTGKDRDHRPEQTHGELVQASEELQALAVVAARNPQRAAALRLRLLDYHAHFLPLLLDVYREINARTTHDLEGWHAAGNVVIEYRTTPDASHWLTDSQFAALPDVSQQLLLTTAQADPRFIRTRKLSPAEVRARDAHGLVRLPAFVVCELLGEDFARELKVCGAYFHEFSDHELAPEPLRFESVITTPDGHVEQLADGTYLAFVNPFDLDQLFVCDARGRCLGMAPRAQRIDRHDPEALKRAFGHRAHRIAELKRPLLARHAQTVRDEMKRLEENATVLDEREPFTPEEMANAATIRSEGRAAAAEILSPAEPVAANEENGDAAASELLSAMSAHNHNE